LEGGEDFYGLGCAGCRCRGLKEHAAMTEQYGVAFSLLQGPMEIETCKTNGDAQYGEDGWKYWMV
jgi:hypothetical protein